MKIFLAGGNNKNNIMKIYLAGGESRHWLLTPLQDENIPCGRSTVERRGATIRL